MDNLTLSFSHTNLLDAAVSVRIASLEGERARPAVSELLRDPALRHAGWVASPCSDLYVTCQVFADSKALINSVRTSYKAFRNRRVWNEWITLPIQYSHLPRTAILTLTLWDLKGPRKHVPYGGASVTMFDADGTFKAGRQKLKVTLDREADGSSQQKTDGQFESTDEMNRLERLVKKHEAGEIQSIDWLDNMVFRQVELINQQSRNDSSCHFLHIEFPNFDYPLVFGEPQYPILPYSSSFSIPDSNGLYEASSLAMLFDPEIMRDNPVEAKHRRLIRSHRNGQLDQDLKPNAKIRDELNEILNYSPLQQLSNEEKDLLWKFRCYLTRDKRAMTKFLKCVIWSDVNEVRQAIELLERWTEVDIDEALELLGPTFDNRSVRAYAVQRLRKAEDDELRLYLLQLVQALKFEKNESVSTGSADELSLAQFLVERAVDSPILGNDLYWYLSVECEDLVRGKLFARVAYQYMTALTKLPDGNHRRDTMRRQTALVNSLFSISKTIRTSKESRPKKIERLQGLVSDPASGLAHFEPLPLPLDANITINGMKAKDCTVFKSSLFPLRIALIQNDTSKSSYPIIFKTGDDLRQDQLVMQIITLMDRLLRKENLDLKLTPYRVMATGVTHGMLQFVSSVTLATALSDFNGSILAFLKYHNPGGSSETYGVKSEAMDNYIKSCAGYCVITYILGVGDRHLDNLLLTLDGRFFHADFGYILGRDPKPYPPAMKLSREMVDGMGGSQSMHYDRFRGYCFTAYTALRKSANLILNLFSLMVDANIPDIKLEPDKAVAKVKDKFCLEMSEEEAIKHFQSLINESMGAVFPQMIDR